MRFASFLLLVVCSPALVYADFNTVVWGTGSVYIEPQSNIVSLHYRNQIFQLRNVKATESMATEGLREISKVTLTIVSGDEKPLLLTSLPRSRLRSDGLIEGFRLIPSSVSNNTEFL